jgi:hypothetical protein
VRSLAKAKVKIVIPTPALSEALVGAGAKAANDYLASISKSHHFRIAPFDERAALEVAFMTQAAIISGDKKSGSPDTWAKIKYDRQIVAIAKVAGAGIIYTDDRNMRALAFANGLRSVSVADLQIPSDSAQMNMDLQAQPSPTAMAEEPEDDDQQ